MFLLNAAFNILLAPLVGKVISRIGERAALVFEYIGLIGVFIAYAFVEDGALAAGLYVIDHMFFAFAIAIKTYFQKIGDPADMARQLVLHLHKSYSRCCDSSCFWSVVADQSRSSFLSGAAMAVVSLLLSLNVPRNPQAGDEVVLGYRGQFTNLAE